MPSRTRRRSFPPRPERVIARPRLTPAVLDLLIDKHLAEAKVPEAAATTDVEFVRRVTLDLTGKLPTPEQVYNFVQTHEKDKRPKLIEFLLNSKDFAGNLARLLAQRDQVPRDEPERHQVGYDEFEDWIAAQIEKKRPWDKIAHDIITASGRSDENGAVGVGAGAREPGGRDGRRGGADLHGGADPVRPVPRPSDRLVEAAAVSRVRLVLRRQ